jgi:hypothetical protein
MIRICPKCSAYFAGDSSPFCRVDGTPLVQVDPQSEQWNEGTRQLEEKAKNLRVQKRKLKWRRVLTSATTMLVTTVVVCVVAVNAVIYLKPKAAESVPPKPSPVAPVPGKSIAASATPTPTPTPTPECTAADRSHEEQVIVLKFGAAWLAQAQADRDTIISQNLPGVPNIDAQVVPEKHHASFNDRCTRSSVTVTYVWHLSTKVKGIKPVDVRQDKTFVCKKAGGIWNWP